MKADAVARAYTASGVVTSVTSSRTAILTGTISDMLSVLRSGAEDGH